MIRIFHTHGRSFLWLLFAGAVLVQIIGLYQPSYSSGPLPFAHADKVAHIMLFGAVAATGRWVGIPARYLLIGLAVHAGVSEVVQEQFIPGRGGDIFDAVADVTGIILGWYVAGLVARLVASWVRSREIPEVTSQQVTSQEVPEQEVPQKGVTGASRLRSDRGR